MTDVALCDGSVVDSASEEWRAECEARHVLAMPTKRHRHDYLNRVMSKRGKPARDRLEADVWRVYEAARAAG